MSKQTIALIIVLIVITAGLFYLAMSSQQKNIGNKTTAIPSRAPSPTPVAQTTLSLSPNPYIIGSPSGSLDVFIATGPNKVTAVQLELSFDPTVITSIEVTPGTFFDTPITLLKNIDKKNGRISYALGVSPTARLKTGTGIVATLTFQTQLSIGQKTQISFLPKSLATAEGVSESVLKTASGTTVFYIKNEQPKSVIQQPTTAAIPPMR